MDSSELDNLRKGHPLKFDGEIVYFRSVRFSSLTGNALVAVVDRAKNTLAVEFGEFSWLDLIRDDE